MSAYLLQGLLLGLAYVAPIGMQNLYVINTALRVERKRAMATAFITTFFDISLALVCFWGVGALVNTFPLLKGVILLTGCLVVTGIGLMLMRSQPNLSNNAESVQDSWPKVIASCFVLTWFNPQAIIDGSLLLGGYQASLPAGTSNYFIMGVCLASFSWFLSLAVVTSIFRSTFKPAVIRWINIACGTVIMFYGLKLGYSFIQLIK
jgi:L-lysine exporter family protein LysE/ArgO